MRVSKKGGQEGKEGNGRGNVTHEEERAGEGA